MTGSDDLTTSRPTTTADTPVGRSCGDPFAIASIDFATVARLLTKAAALVRTRRELGDIPSVDHRPRIGAAIGRAAEGTRATTRPVRHCAVQLAAAEINAALGRDRNRDRGDAKSATRTLTGFGLDIGTIGAVDAAADLLTKAATTADLISRAAMITVHGYGPVLGYPLGPASARDVEVNDILGVLHGIDAITDTGPIHYRVHAITVHANASRTITLDIAGPPHPLRSGQVRLTADQRCRSLWRAVPHLRHPWERSR